MFQKMGLLRQIKVLTCEWCICLYKVQRTCSDVWIQLYKVERLKVIPVHLLLFTQLIPWPTYSKEM